MSYKESHPIQHFLTNLTGGGVAASISKTVNSPFEVAKLILQTQPGRFAGLRDLLTRLPAQEGITALWRGNGVNVLRYFPTQALNFAFKDTYNDLLMPNPRSSYSYWEQFGRGLLAGGAAGATALPFVFPLDLCRTRLSTDQKDAQGKRRYTGLRHVAAEAVKTNGFRGLYKGFGIAMVGIVPYRAIYFGGYDTLKSLFLSDERKHSFAWKWAISQTNTILAQYIVYPYDTTKRTMMKNGEVQADGTVRRAYRNTFECIADIKRTSGLRGFYRGALANTFRATGAALCMALYDTFQDLLKARQK